MKYPLSFFVNARKAEEKTRPHNSIDNQYEINANFWKDFIKISVGCCF